MINLMILFRCIASAIPWWLMNDNSYYHDICGCEFNTYLDAFAFTVEIIMTLGLGAK